eukprot:TRINITY_DN38254_c0_g1_i1.p1 TRINITY_DN38254_c0_g1~~TRINITY_DN38254_c0_g1_i1.p1  ORF type:complete len:747 (-),score=121.37 TRINITY_DN38254_c0_g1_i1:164-2404(-)
MSTAATIACGAFFRPVFGACVTAKPPEDRAAETRDATCEADCTFGDELPVRFPERHVVVTAVSDPLSRPALDFSPLASSRELPTGSDGAETVPEDSAAAFSPPPVMTVYDSADAISSPPVATPPPPVATVYDSASSASHPPTITVHEPASPCGHPLRSMSSMSFKADDIAWVSRSVASPTSPSASLARGRMMSRALSRSRSKLGASASSASLPASGDVDRESGDTSDVHLPGLAQVFLSGKWVDMVHDDFVQICDHLARGESKFNIVSRGQNYSIDVTGRDGATQENLTTGRKRKLRFIDAADDHGHAEPEDPLETHHEIPLHGDRFGLSPVVEGDEAKAEMSTPVASVSGPPALPPPLPPPSAEAPTTEEETKPPGAAASAEAKPKVKAKKKAKARPKAPAEVLRQKKLGPQSKRGDAPQFQLNTLDIFPHAKACFEQFAVHEEKLCPECAVFYHSYSYAALIYEVQAAVAAVLFRFRSQFSPLPRLLFDDFNDTPTVDVLMEKFKTRFAKDQRDHDPEYRAVAISTMVSLCAMGPECSPPIFFLSGYAEGCADMSFRSVLDHLLEACFVPKKAVKSLGDKILKLCEKYGLDVSPFGGAKCPSGKSGHLLQIFIRRNLLDELVYASEPWGVIDEEHQPISKWLNGNCNTSYGQARILANPKHFMTSNSVRMFVASADPTFHESRKEFQAEMRAALKEVLGDPEVRSRAATGIYGGTLPSWWTSEDQSELAAMGGEGLSNAKYPMS